MISEAIKQHAKKFYERMDNMSLKSPLRLGGFSHEPDCFLYAMRVLGKKNLLSEKTRKELYEALAEGYQNREIFPLARKYLILAGRKDELSGVDYALKEAKQANELRFEADQIDRSLTMRRKIISDARWDYWTPSALINHSGH
jgi:hypothetical protein